MPKEELRYSIFTVCNLYYLPKALALAESVHKHNGCTLKIFLCDQKAPLALEYPPVDIIWVQDLQIDNLKQLAFKYDIIEFSTCLKPYIAARLLEEAKYVIFLDPDTYVCHSLEPIIDDLNQHWLVLTPHYTTPQSDDLSESDLGMMRFGSFNLGFFAIKQSSEAKRFLDWWWSRCQALCYMEAQFGLSVDQKWISIAPALFPGIHVTFNLGYNAAPWNTYERELSVDEQGRYWVNKHVPLVFFHFSNFDRTDPEYLNKRALIEREVRRPMLGMLSAHYDERTRALKPPIADTKYGFDYMSGGEYISPTLRRAYSAVLKELPADHDPFDSKGAVGHFARMNGLFERTVTPYSAVGFRHLGRYGTALKIVNSLLRSILWAIGSNRFQNLSRLMVYLSSYRLNRDLWKV